MSFFRVKARPYKKTGFLKRILAYTVQRLLYIFWIQECDAYKLDICIQVDSRGENCHKIQNKFGESNDHMEG